MGVAPGTAALAASVGDASAAGFGSSLRDAGLVGEAGLPGGADGTFLAADDGGHGAVRGSGQRRAGSWRVSLSRAVFWQNRQTDRQIFTHL